MPDRTWEDLKSSAIMDSANHRAYRIGIGDAFNDAIDTIFFDLKIAEGTESPTDISILLGEYKIAKVLFDHLQEANRQHEEALSNMLRVDIFERIEDLDVEKEEE